MVLSYCINPKCHDRLNPAGQDICQACGTPLLIQGHYRLLQPLRPLEDWSTTEIFEVIDQSALPETETPEAKHSEVKTQERLAPHKVLKILKQPHLLSLFEREARVLQQLDHPGVPQVEADAYFTVVLASQAEPLPCFMMEKIQGETLDQWLNQRGPIDQKRAEDWLTQLIEILQQIHQKDLFHRDLKPSNIMHRPNGQLVLIDFGTVKQVTNTYLAKIAGRREITSVVSPGYTPLEQINGKAVPQSDFYALGRSFVQLLTGKSPLDFEEDLQTGNLHWQASAAHLSPPFIQLIDDLMAPFPGQRPTSAAAIAQRLNSLQRDQPPKTAPIPSSTPPKSSTRTLFFGLMGINLVLLFLQVLIFLRWYEAWQAQPPERASGLDRRSFIR